MQMTHMKEEAGSSVERFEKLLAQSVKAHAHLWPGMNWRPDQTDPRLIQDLNRKEKQDGTVHFAH